MMCIMLTGDMRFFIHLEAEIEAVPARGVGSELWEMSELISSLQSATLPYAYDLNDHAAIELLDLEVKHGVAVVLMGYTDERASDPAFRNRRKNRRRIVRKQLGEGLTHSAHIAFNLVPTASRRYEVLLEQVPRVGRTNTMMLLNKIWATSPQLVKVNVQQKTMHPKCRLIGMKGEGLEHVLRTGRLHGVELVRDVALGEVGATEPGWKQAAVKQCVQVQARPPKTFKPVDQFRKMFERGKAEDFSSLRVSFTHGETDKRLTVELDLHDSARDTLYVKHTLERFDVSLGSAPEKVVPAVSRKMRERMGIFDHQEQVPCLEAQPSSS